MMRTSLMISIFLLMGTSAGSASIPRDFYQLGRLFTPLPRHQAPLDQQQTQELLIVTSDLDNLVARLGVVLENGTGNVQGMYYRTVANQLIHYTLQDIEKGVVLMKDDGTGLNVVSMKTEDFTAAAGGSIQMTYLSNGIKKTYQSHSMALKLEGGKFQLFDTQTRTQRPISEMFMKKNTFLGRVIGIKEIQTR